MWNILSEMLLPDLVAVVNPVTRLPSALGGLVWSETPSHSVIAHAHLLIGFNMFSRVAGVERSQQWRDW